MDKLAQKTNKGFSTIELMIAMAIMVLVLTAVVMTSFGSQTFLSGSQTNAEAMKRAQALLEEEQALARKDFNLVNPKEEMQVPDDIYSERVDVKLLDDYLTKEVTAIVSWTNERGVGQDVALTTLITNFDNASSPNTCSSALSGDWNSPTKDSTNVGSFAISDIDAYMDKLYVSTDSSSSNTFFIYNLSTAGIPSSNPVVSIDTSGSASTKGPNSFVIGSPSKNETYAFIANGASPADWATCVQGSNCSQLQILDVNNTSNLVNYKINTVLGTAPQGVGKSIYYKNGYIFLGLSSTSSSPEFYIIDVHDPSIPVITGSLEIGATVSSIYVTGSYAYLATADNAIGGNGTMIVVDIRNPTLPKMAWTKIFSSSFGYGNALSRVGNNLYFGMTNNTSNPEFYTLDNSSPSTQKPTISSSINLDSNLGVYGIVIRDYLINILTSGKNLKIVNTKDNSETSITIPGNGTSMDCQGNYIYVGDDDGNITSITAL